MVYSEVCCLTYCRCIFFSSIVFSFIHFKALLLVVQNLGLLCPLDELIPLSSNLVLSISLTYLMSVLEKQENTLENIQETEGKMFDDRGS